MHFRNLLAIQICIIFPTSLYKKRSRIFQTCRLDFLFSYSYQYNLVAHHCLEIISLLRKTNDTRLFHCILTDVRSPNIVQFF